MNAQVQAMVSVMFPFALGIFSGYGIARIVDKMREGPHA